MDLSFKSNNSKLFLKQSRHWKLLLTKLRQNQAELDRFCDAMIQIRKEIDEIANGVAHEADNVLKNKVKSMEEADEARKLARAAERDLQQRLSKELESAKLNALLVQESWRKIMRTIKVSLCEMIHM
jgi:GTPase involved in cell partitioning and DNA repair